MFFLRHVRAGDDGFLTVEISGQAGMHTPIFKRAYKGGECRWVQIDFRHRWWAFGVRLHGFQDFMQPQLWVCYNLR